MLLQCLHLRPKVNHGSSSGIKGSESIDHTISVARRQMRVARSDRRAIITRADPKGIKDVPTGTEPQCVIRKGHVNVEEQLTSSSQPGRSWDQRLAGPRHRLGDQRQRVPDQGRLPADAQPRSQHGEGGDHLRENELPVREFLRGSAECEPPSSSFIPWSIHHHHSLSSLFINFSLVVFSISYTNSSSLL